MLEPQSLTETVSASEARQQWSQLLNHVFRGQKRVVVERSGVPVAAIISAQDLERFQRYEAERAERFAVIDRLRAAFDDVPDDELERQVKLAIAETRAQYRLERAEQINQHA